MRVIRQSSSGIAVFRVAIIAPSWALKLHAFRWINVMKLRTESLFDNLNISMLQQLATMVLLTVGLMTLTGCFVGNWFGGGDMPSVAYISSDGDDSRVWINQSGEDDPMNVSPRSAQAKSVSWSPGQRYLAWVAGGDIPLLMLYDVESGETELLVSEIDQDQPPVWAPQSDRVAYVSDVDGSPDIYMVDIATGDQTRLTFSDEREQVGDWSPDGQWLVFTRAGHDGLLLRNPTGVNLIELTDGADSNPIWSPKGDRIAFLRDAGEDLDLYVLRPTESDNWADDTDEIAVAETEYDESSPSWSADGRQIAYVVRFDDQSEIFTVRVDGSERKQLTYNTADDLAPDWSYTGDLIVFSSFAYGNSEILYMKGDGDGQTRLTTNDHMDSQPTW
jgi:Tol biopolymer transport system component